MVLVYHGQAISGASRCWWWLVKTAVSQLVCPARSQVHLSDLCLFCHLKSSMLLECFVCLTTSTIPIQAGNRSYMTPSPAPSIKFSALQCKFSLWDDSTTTHNWDRTVYSIHNYHMERWRLWRLHVYIQRTLGMMHLRYERVCILDVLIYMYTGPCWDAHAGLGKVQLAPHVRSLRLKSCGVP